MPPCCQGTRLWSRNRVPSSMSPWAAQGPAFLAQLTTWGWALWRSPLSQTLGFLSSETQLGVHGGGCEVLELLPHPGSQWSLTVGRPGQGHHQSSHYSTHCNGTKAREPARLRPEWEGLAEALDTPPTSPPRPPSPRIRSRGIWLSTISLGKPVQSPSPDQEGLGVLRRVGALVGAALTLSEGLRTTILAASCPVLCLSSVSLFLSLPLSSSISLPTTSLPSLIPKLQPCHHSPRSIKWGTPGLKPAWLQCPCGLGAVTSVS